MEVILGKTAGFCYGVKRAVDGAIHELNNCNEVICCLGHIVHNADVIDFLEKKGMKFIENIEDASGKTLIRAHGVPKSVYENAKCKNIELIDFTCPNVLKIHDIVKKYYNENYFIFLCGSKVHPENIGTISFCEDSSFVIESLDDIDEALKSFEKSNKKDLLLVSQTTFSCQKFDLIEKAIKNKITSDINFVVKNTICKATEIRQQETEKISKDADCMIIIGGKNSSNTKKLFEIAKQNCEKTIFIESSKELDISILNGKVGVMAGASTPDWVINEVVNLVEMSVQKGFFMI